jgi:DNA invertase Pin-like site-specific DNA recombinase
MTKPERIWRVALYMRLSRDDGNAESMSIGNQREQLQSYLKDFEPHELAGEYADDDYTGTDTSRPAFQQMIADVYTGKVNCVIVKTLSRLSRNDMDTAHYLQYVFPEYHTRFISLDLPAIDTYKDPDSVHDLQVKIYTMFNDNFAMQTSKNVRRTLKQKREKGEFIGSFAPYGYQKDPNDRHRLLPEAHTAEVVRNIFTWYSIDGMSQLAIAHKLNALGLPNPTEQKRLDGSTYQNTNSDTNDGLWSSHTVKLILSNEVYLGKVVQGKSRVLSYKVHKQVRNEKNEWTVVPGMHEPLISQETFDRVQQLLGTHSLAAHGSSNIHLFSGFLVCADCGKKLKHKASGGYGYYICRSYTDKKVCSRHSVREDDLKRTMLIVINKKIAQVAEIQSLIDIKGLAGKKNTVSDRLESVRQTHLSELEKTHKLLDRLVPLLVSEMIDEAEYTRLRTEYKTHEASIIEALQQVEQEIRKLAEYGINGEDNCITAFLKYKSLKELDRSVLLELIERIIVHESGYIDVEFKYAERFELIQEQLKSNADFF